MTRSGFALPLVFGLAMPIALADAIPPPAPHTPTQDKLRGTWQEQGCHIHQPVMHHSTPCPIRTMTFGDTTLAIVTSTGVRERTEITAVAAAWAEVSSDDASAIIRPNLGAELWTIRFTDADDVSIASGNEAAAQFKRVRP